MTSSTMISSVPWLFVTRKPSAVSSSPLLSRNVRVLLRSISCMGLRGVVRHATLVLRLRTCTCPQLDPRSGSMDTWVMKTCSSMNLKVSFPNGTLLPSIKSLIGIAIPYHVCLTLRYVIAVEFKGGTVRWIPKRIWITTNTHPREWWDWTDREQRYPSLCRRVTHLHLWSTIGESLTLNGPVPVDGVVPSAPSWTRWWYDYDKAQAAPPRRQLELGQLWVEQVGPPPWQWKYNWFFND